MGNGAATVRATYGQLNAEARVTVRQVVASVKVTPGVDSLVAIGDTARFTAEAADANSHAVAEASVTWRSLDTAVAKVDSTGLVTALAAGSAVIEATADSTVGSGVVEVAQAVNSITVTPARGTVSVGDTLRFLAEAADANGNPVGSAVAFAWESSDPAVASVDSAGLVTGRGAGSTEITAAISGVAGTAALWVLGSLDLSIKPDSVALTALGDTVRLVAMADDTVVTADVAWTSGDVAVATVGESGLVRAGGEGRATVTAAVGADSATAVVTVSLRTDAASDRRSLAAFYHAAGGNGWLQDDNWLTDAPLEEWHGVATDAEGRVTELTLSDNGAVGSLAPELGNLSRLARLDLYRNRLTGPLPPQLGHAVRLEHLDIGRNQLSGSIPAALGGLRSLRHANFEAQWFSGSIPPELGNLTELRFLNFWSNTLTGSLPVELAGLGRLEILHVDDNRLSGVVPPAFTDLGSLEEFTWGANRGLCAPATRDFRAWLGRLSGGGPSCDEEDRAVLHVLHEAMGGADWRRDWGWLDADLSLADWEGVGTDTIGRVETLDLADNNLAGTLPAALSKLDRLRVLGVGGNPSLGGRVPLSLADLPLKEFRYRATGLCVPGLASFQAWLAALNVHEGTDEECPAFTERDILRILYEQTGGENWTRSDNWLTDRPLETWYGIEMNSNGGVQGIQLDGNNLRGTIPPELGQLEHLLGLQLHYNWLTGRIPPQLGDLGVLETLVLISNLLTGPIPPELANLPKLKFLELSDNRLEGTIPPELGRMPILENLYLDQNWLKGPIPVELGNLRNLTFLTLHDNQLSGSIPREIGNWTSLRDLTLSGNFLEGPIPPEIGRLTLLDERLWLDGNQLTGPIPPELGNLSRVKWVYLGFNRLSGEIPAELGGLDAVQALSLDVNELTGAIPRELGSLTNIEWELNLRENRLTGPIPAELGNLRSLKTLRLGSNRLEGEIPPELGGMANLEWLDLSYNPGLGGPFPPALAALARLGRFEGAGTGFCVPEELLDWAVGRARAPRCEASTGSQAYLTQTVQSLEYPTALIAGEEALLRVFVVADDSTGARIPPVRATFFAGGAEIHSAEIAGKPAAIPTDIARAEASLDHSANAPVPADVVRPGLEMVIEIDPDGTLDPRLGVTARIPESGRQKVVVRDMPTFNLTIVPFLWQDNPDSAVVELTAEMAADPEGHRLLWDTHNLLPVGDLALDVHEPVLTSVNDGDHLLDEVGAIRAIEGGSGHWMASISGDATGPWGVAWIPGWTSYVRLGIVTLAEEALTIAHELGHNMSLYHAPCGTGSTLDRAYPYPNGSIGAWGLDPRPGGPLLVPITQADLMSYCVPAWVGEYNFSKAMNHRILTESGAASQVAPTRTILLWGGTDADGTPYLNPAFATDAPPALPGADGDWRITGRGAGGTVLFSFGFDMAAAAHAPERKGFVFAVPFRPEWADALAEITLSGPSGGAVIDRNTNRPAVIVRDRATGLVRAILRDVTAAAAAAASDAAILPGMDGLEVLTSSGIPGAMAWRR